MSTQGLAKKFEGFLVLCEVASWAPHKKPGALPPHRRSIQEERVLTNAGEHDGNTVRVPHTAGRRSGRSLVSANVAAISSALAPWAIRCQRTSGRLAESATQRARIGGCLNGGI